ncbi:MAG: hypothetical protein K2K89_03785 [Ruminococcus sp.]|nr:hypothetical protein [Ruminococcus sp.]
MAYYLIDYENVHVSGMNGFSGLTAADNVVIFYSDNSDSLTFGLHKKLMNALCQVEYHKVETGTKNALDFQLSAYLGYVIKENESKSDNKFFIVTKDNGFSVLCTYWKKKNISVEIISSLAGNKNPVTVVVPKAVEKTAQSAESQDELKKAVSKVINNKADIDFVVSTVKKSRTRSAISNQFNQHFKDGKKVHEIFTVLKPFIKNMPGQ